MVISRTYFLFPLIMSYFEFINCFSLKLVKFSKEELVY
jgi:hypothetical protein